jgi:hypothetical protein
VDPRLVVVGVEKTNGSCEGTDLLRNPLLGASGVRAFVNYFRASLLSFSS